MNHCCAFETYIILYSNCSSIRKIILALVFAVALYFTNVLFFKQNLISLNIANHQKEIVLGVPVVAQQVKNLTLCPWGCGFDPWPHSVGQGSGVSMNFGVCCRCSLDPVLLWLWCRPWLQLRFSPSPGNFHMP